MLDKTATIITAAPPANAGSPHQHHQRTEHREGGERARIHHCDLDGCAGDELIPFEAPGMRVDPKTEPVQ